MLMNTLHESVAAYSLYCTWEIWVREKLVNRELFAKIFLTNIFTDTSKMYSAYALTVADSQKFSVPIAFNCMVHQKFFLSNFLSMGVLLYIMYARVLIRTQLKSSSLIK